MNLRPLLAAASLLIAGLALAPPTVAADTCTTTDPSICIPDECRPVSNCIPECSPARECIPPEVYVLTRMVGDIVFGIVEENVCPDTTPVNDCTDYLQGQANEAVAEWYAFADQTADNAAEDADQAVQDASATVADYQQYALDTANGALADANEMVETYQAFLQDTADGAVEDANQAVADATNQVYGALDLVDADGDSVPDQAENELCGRAAVRDALEDSPAYAGRCTSNADYAVNPDAYVVWVLEQVDAAIDLVNAAIEMALEEADRQLDALLVVLEDLQAQVWEAVDEAMDDVSQAIVEARDEALELIDDAVEQAEDTVATVQDTLGDRDHDGVPDDREPAICSAENQNSPTDGHCVGSDYVPPA